MSPLRNILQAIALTCMQQIRRLISVSSVSTVGQVLHAGISGLAPSPSSASRLQHCHHCAKAAVCRPLPCCGASGWRLGLLSFARCYGATVYGTDLSSTNYGLGSSVLPVPLGQCLTGLLELRPAPPRSWSSSLRGLDARCSMAAQRPLPFFY